MGRLIFENGEEKEVSPKDGKYYSLGELQQYVEGLIELVYFNNGQIMVINEEGKFYCSLNEKATTVAREHRAIFSHDYICGNALIINENEIE